MNYPESLVRSAEEPCAPLEVLFLARLALVQAIGRYASAQIPTAAVRIPPLRNRLSKAERKQTPTYVPSFPTQTEVDSGGC